MQKWSPHYLAFLVLGKTANFLEGHLGHSDRESSVALGKSPEVFFGHRAIRKTDFNLLS